MDNLLECSQCHNIYDETEIIEQDFDGTIVKICAQCLEEVMTGERTIVV